MVNASDLVPGGIIITDKDKLFLEAAPDGQGGHLFVRSEAGWSIHSKHTICWYIHTNGCTYIPPVRDIITRFYGGA